MDPQHHDTAEYIADEGNDFRIQLDSADAAFNLGSPQFPHTPSYNGSYHNSPYSGHSELSFSGGDLGLFEEDAAVVPEYDPSEYDPPQSSSLLMFNDTDYSFSSVPVNVERGTSYDYSSPSSTGSGEQRSRASSISQSGSPRMNVAQAFDNMTFRSPNWGTDPLPRDRPPSPHPKSPPRLMTAPIINAPEGDGLGPRLHIVPATPVSGGGAASTAVPFQTSLETLREPPQEQPLHFPRPRSSSDHDPPSWDNGNFIGQMGNIGSAIDDEAPRQRPSFNSFNFGDNGFLSPDLRRSRSASEHTRPGHTRQTRSEDMRSLLPVDFSGPQFLSPVDPPPSIRAHGKHYRSHSSGSARSWSNASSTRPSPYPSPHASPSALPPVPLPSLPHDIHSNLNTSNNTVSKQNVTTIRTQKASHNRRKQEATFVCPVPGCGSTFTRSFNLKGHIRSHNEERPFLCKWPGCGKGFARQHDCKRHEQLHTNYRPFVCEGCGKQFARMDALNRHLRSEGGADCQRTLEANGRMPDFSADFPPAPAPPDSGLKLGTGGGGRARSHSAGSYNGDGGGGSGLRMPGPGMGGGGGGGGLLSMGLGMGGPMGGGVGVGKVEDPWANMSGVSL